MDTWECEQPEWLETLKILRHHKEILDTAYNANPLPDTPTKKRKIDPEYSTGKCECHTNMHGSHRDWKSGKTWKNGKAFSSQGKVREFCQDWKSQGILPKILEKQENLNKKNVFCESQGILHKMLENQWI